MFLPKSEEQFLTAAFCRTLTLPTVAFAELCQAMLFQPQTTEQRQHSIRSGTARTPTAAIKETLLELGTRVGWVGCCGRSFWPVASTVIKGCRFVG